MSRGATEVAGKRLFRRIPSMVSQRVAGGALIVRGPGRPQPLVAQDGYYDALPLEGRRSLQDPLLHPAKHLFEEGAGNRLVAAADHDVSSVESVGKAAF